MKSKCLILLVLTGLLFLAGCEKNLDKASLSSSFVRPKITAPTGGTNFAITPATEADTMTKFTFSAPDFGYEAAVTYTLQITKTTNFADANNIATSNKTNIAVLNSKMNTTLLIFGVDTSVFTPIRCRIMAVVNPNVAPIYSDTAVINVKAFEKKIVYPMLFVPGDYQGWNAGDSTTVLSSVKSDNKYEGYLYLSGATTGMKFLKVPRWEADNTIGDPNASGTSGTLQIGSWGGNNIAVSGGPGLFKVNANLVDATYTWLKTDWGLIGSATPDGWNSDQNMTYDVANKVWTLTVNLIVGEIKFRANDGWTWNLGDNLGDKKLQYNGSNIPITVAGNYTITLDLSKAVYRYKVVKNP